MRFGREQLTMLGLQKTYFYCYTCSHSKVTFQCSLVAWDQLLVFEGTQPSESEHSWRRGQDLVSPAVMDSRLGDTGEWGCWSLVWRGGGGGLVSCVSGTWSRVSGGDNWLNWNTWYEGSSLEHGQCLTIGEDSFRIYQQLRPGLVWCYPSLDHINCPVFTLLVKNSLLKIRLEI